MTTPWEKHEEEQALESLRKMAMAAEARKTTHRWLVTLRTADGAERHISWCGLPGRTVRLPLRREIRLEMTEPSIIEPICVPIREYELEDYNINDCTAVYAERIR